MLDSAEFLALITLQRDALIAKGHMPRSLRIGANARNRIFQDLRNGLITLPPGEPGKTLLGIPLDPIPTQGPDDFSIA